jgi:uncharacterized damage-inducible protein DinB
MSNVNLEKVPSFYHNYIKQMSEDNLTEAFVNNIHNIIPFLKAIPDEKWSYRYAPGKWSIKEMIQHLIDAERIFCYRALTFARLDDKLLPGFDENHYVAVSKADNRDPDDLIEELDLVHRSSARLFDSFDEEQLQAEGTANNNRIYVEAIGCIIIGHSRHHLKILKERYLS